MPGGPRETTRATTAPNVDRHGRRRLGRPDLLAGWITGPEARGRFVAMNATNSTTARSVGLLFPGRTDADRAARYVRESGHPRAAEVARAIIRDLLADDDGTAPRAE